MFLGGFIFNFGGNIIDIVLIIGIKGEIIFGFFEGVYYDLSGIVGYNELCYFIYDIINVLLGLDSLCDFSFGKYL